MPIALSAAQLVIAREHGFSSWAQMKTLVTRMASNGTRYNSIGRGYGVYRTADPRIRAAIDTALGDARAVVNVGAGTGSYEPRDRPVIPIEPSTAMAQQRDPTLSPAVLGVAESLPLADSSVDAAMAVLTMHHWTDIRRGLSEMRRVARRRVVLLTIDVDIEAELWLLRDYVPQIMNRDRVEFPSIDRLVLEMRAPTKVLTVPVPADCTDGFLLAFWSRPEAVLDPGARAATSGFARISKLEDAAAVTRLDRDLKSGVWDDLHGPLRGLSELDVGLRLLVTEFAIG